MAKYNKRVRLKISHWYIKNLFKIDRGYSAEFFNWNKTGTECNAVFMCSDEINTPDINANHSKEDLEEYVIKKFGANILKENIPISKKVMDIKENHVVSTTVDTNEALKLLEPSARTAYKQDYFINITPDELRNINKSLRQYPKSKDMTVKPFSIKQKPSFEPDLITLRLGKWL